MEEFVSRLDPIRISTVSLGGTLIGYLAIKNLQAFFSIRDIKHFHPPVPQKEPLIGGLRSFPKDRFFECFCEWATTYDDIVYAPIMGTDVVILNSYEAAQELLSKRPHTTGNRHVGYFFGNMMKWDWSLALVQPNSHHSDQRKILRKAIGPQRVGSYDSMIESEVAKLMPKLLSFTGDPSYTVKQLLGRIMLKITYGETIWSEMGLDLSRWNIEANELINEAFFTFWLVDIFHFLRYIPDCFETLPFIRVSKK